MIRTFVEKAEAWLNNLHGAALLAIFAVVGSILYAFDDPSFGFNISSIAEIVGFVGAIVVTTSVTEIARGVYVHRRFKKIGDLRAYPLGIVIAIGFDIFSRISHFEPGYVFGIMAAIVFRVKPTGEEDGKSITYSSLWLMGLSALGWLGFSAVNPSVIAGNHAFMLLVIESMLSYVWICGLQSLFFGLIPARTMDGHAIFAWSKGTWLAIFGTVTFIFTQFILHPSAAGYGGNSNTKLLPMIAIFIFSSVAAGGFWLYSYMRYGKSEHDAEPGVDAEISA